MLQEKMLHIKTEIQKIIVLVISQLKQLGKTVLTHAQKLLANVIPMRKTCVYYLGMTLLAIGKPFTRIGNWFWKKHRTVLNWNK